METLSRSLLKGLDVHFALTPRERSPIFPFYLLKPNLTSTNVHKKMKSEVSERVQVYPPKVLPSLEESSYICFPEI